MDWRKDLRQAFTYALPDQINEHGEIPDAFSSGLVEAWGEEDRDVDFVHAVERGDQTGFLIVRGNDAWLVRFEPPSLTELIYVGDLRGGRYVEQVAAEKNEHVIEASFEHERLGQETLRARIEKPYPRAGVHTSDRTDYLVERGDQLRQRFVAWSMEKARAYGEGV